MAVLKNLQRRKQGSDPLQDEALARPGEDDLDHPVQAGGWKQCGLETDAGMAGKRLDDGKAEILDGMRNEIGIFPEKSEIFEKIPAMGIPRSSVRRDQYLHFLTF
ncbi:hypothetical protein [Gluconacetobacter takamatsuzukensis]|uniref:hypothetical protein n=1 Tax=Gluconacetobacter takamatsuzukensis TaxID=1286190 RepID=UPI001FE3D879|nr:hypothetical protein [Gluconacetobacter takamatsuzukensis]